MCDNRCNFCIIVSGGAEVPEIISTQEVEEVKASGIPFLQNTGSGAQSVYEENETGIYLFTLN
jgi:hypothetical protein